MVDDPPDHQGVANPQTGINVLELVTLRTNKFQANIASLNERFVFK